MSLSRSDFQTSEVLQDDISVKIVLIEPLFCRQRHSLETSEVSSSQ